MVNQWLVSLLWNFAYQVLRAKFSNIILTRQLSGLSLAFMDVSLLWVYQAQVWPLATLHLLYLPSFLISVTMWCAKILCLLAIFSRMNLPWKEWRTYAFLNYYHYFIRHCATSLLSDEEKGCGLKKKEKRFSSDFDVTEEFDSCLSIGMGFFLRGELREAILLCYSGQWGAGCVLGGNPFRPCPHNVKAKLFSQSANKILCPAAYLKNKMNAVSSTEYCKLYSTYKAKVKTNSLLAVLGNNVLLLSMTYKPWLQATISNASHSLCINGGTD